MEELKDLIDNQEESKVEEKKEEVKIEPKKKENEIKVNITKHVEVNSEDINYLSNAAKTMAINNGYANLTKEVYKNQIEFVAKTNKTRFTEDVKRAALHKLTK